MSFSLDNFERWTVDEVANWLRRVSNFIKAETGPVVSDPKPQNAVVCLYCIQCLGKCRMLSDELNDWTSIKLKSIVCVLQCVITDVFNQM